MKLFHRSIDTMLLLTALILDLLQIRFSGGAALTKPNSKTLICKKSIMGRNF